MLGFKLAAQLSSPLLAWNIVLPDACSKKFAILQKKSEMEGQEKGFSYALAKVYFDDPAMSDFLKKVLAIITFQQLSQCFRILRAIS